MPSKLTSEQLLKLQSLVGRHHVSALRVSFNSHYGDTVNIHLEPEESIDDALIAIRNDIFPDINVVTSRTFESSGKMVDTFGAYANGASIFFFETYEKTPDVVRTPEEQENLLPDSTTEWDLESIMRQEG